ncbi:hypothetical protein MFUM_190041 [Methylacidiphilum fumariolicum SolV]|uniref:Uncharacterized protein n=1 Tax=Methylacidiphilum fumariolicum (strain SolV) TaxID=1156937 RepID=I0JWS3_METFB|nr:hypothetical protein MFUM_190041 [Methylacidiphilum fumariolicum SolV]
MRMSIRRTPLDTSLYAGRAGMRAIRIGWAHTTSKKIGNLEILSWTPQNRLYAMLLERFICNSRHPLTGISMRGDCSRA